MAVTPEKIAVAMGVAAPEPDSIQWQQWALWIDDAYMLIEARAEKLDVGIETIDSLKLDYVVREAVVAHVKRPDDSTQVTVAVDDGSTSKSYRSGKGRVTILDEWWSMLGLVEPDEGAFAIDMVPAAGAAHLPWCNINTLAGWCSCGVDIAGVPIYETGGTP